MLFLPDSLQSGKIPLYPLRREYNVLFLFHQLLVHTNSIGANLQLKILKK